MNNIISRDYDYFNFENGGVGISLREYALAILKVQEYQSWARAPKEDYFACGVTELEWEVYRNCHE